MATEASFDVSVAVPRPRRVATATGCDVMRRRSRGEAPLVGLRSRTSRVVLQSPLEPTPICAHICVRAWRSFPQPSSYHARRNALQRNGCAHEHLMPQLRIQQDHYDIASAPCRNLTRQIPRTRFGHVRRSAPNSHKTRCNTRAWTKASKCSDSSCCSATLARNTSSSRRACVTS